MGDVSSLLGPATASSSTPPATALDGATGLSDLYARADHTHAARVQRAIVTTDNSGNATWTFARPFTVLPVIGALANTTGRPMILSITAKSMTSVTINARQSAQLPSTILSLTALLNLDIFANPAVGVTIDIFAADPTQ